MSFDFRVCFKLAGEGTLTSDEEFIAFASTPLGQPLKLSSGTKGMPIGANDRFSISGTGFESPGSAHLAAESVRHALLLFSAGKRCGLDLGQNSLRSFGMSDYGKEYIAKQLGTDLVLEDHLGITVYPSEPKPTFVRINMTGKLSRPAAMFMSNLESNIGIHRLASTKAEIAAGIYALSHFAGRAPARFLLLFIALEALFEPAERPKEVQDHIRSLMATTKASDLEEGDKQSIVSGLSFQLKASIAATGRSLAESVLSEQTYDDLLPGKFFEKIYKTRNNLVHRGQIDPDSLHALVGEVDRFVADIICRQVYQTGDLKAG